MAENENETPEAEQPSWFAYSRIGSDAINPDALKSVARIVEAVVVKPGDVLVFSFADHFTRKQVDAIREHIDAQMPDGVKTLMVGGTVQLHVLRPGDDRG